VSFLIFSSSISAALFGPLLWLIIDLHPRRHPATGSAADVVRLTRVQRAGLAVIRGRHQAALDTGRLALAEVLDRLLRKRQLLDRRLRAVPYVTHFGILPLPGNGPELFPVRLSLRSGRDIPGIRAACERGVTGRGSMRDEAGFC